MSSRRRHRPPPAPRAASPKLEAAILETLDGHREEMETANADNVYRSPGFPLVRSLRDHPELEASDSVQAMAIIEPVLRALWRDQRLPYQEEVADGWYCRACTPLDHGTLGDPQRVAWDGVSCEHSRHGGRDEIWRAAIGQYDNFDKEQFSHPQEDFAAQWDRWSPGALKAALWAVTSDPFWEDSGLFGDRRSASNQGTQRRFLALCAQLSRTSAQEGRSGVFFMSRQRWAEVLGVTEPVVGRWRGAAERDGFLELVNPATHHSGPGARAAEFRWVARWEPGRSASGGRFKPLHEQVTYAERLAAVSAGAVEWARSLPAAPAEVERRAGARRATAAPRRSAARPAPSAEVALATPASVTPSPPVSGSAPESAARASRCPSGPDTLAVAQTNETLTRDLLEIEPETARPTADSDNLRPGTVPATFGSALRLGLGSGVPPEADAASRIALVRGLRALEHGGEEELPEAEPDASKRSGPARVVMRGERFGEDLDDD